MITIKCVCPRIHRFDATLKKRKYAIPSVDAELTNKTLVGTKAHVFCSECKEVTVVLIEDILDIAVVGVGKREKKSNNPSEFLELEEK